MKPNEALAKAREVMRRGLNFDPVSLVNNLVASGKIRFEEVTITVPKRRAPGPHNNREHQRAKRAARYVQGLTARGTPRKHRRTNQLPEERKRWITAEAKRCGVTPHAIYMRLKRGKYPSKRAAHKL